MDRLDRNDRVRTAAIDAETGESGFLECDASFGLALNDVSDLERVERAVGAALLAGRSWIEFVRFHTDIDYLNEQRPLSPEDRMGILGELAREVSEPDEALAALHAAVVFLGNAWREQGVEHLRAVLAISADGEAAAGLLASADTPVLLMEPGSLLAYLGWISGGYKAGKWLLAAHALMRAPGMSASQIAAWFVDEMRQRASGLVPPPRDLPRFDQTSPKLKGEKDAVIILLHGLFSTDLGTFDGFLEQWEAYRQGRRLVGPENCVDEVTNRVHIVGWPHDTLVGIEINAEDLADRICDTLGNSGCSVVLVGHSRGGLLGRATAQKLLKRNGYAWDRRLKGIATFGTPHLGAELARKPFRYAGGMLVVSLSGRRKLAALDRLLIYMHHRRRLDGVDDLAPRPNLVSDFLERLVRWEGQRRPIDCLAVGGALQAPPGSPVGRWMQQLRASTVSLLVGPGQHDLVVSIGSSVPYNLSNVRTVNCNHFEYFGSSQATTVQDVVHNIAGWLGLEDAIRRCRDRV